MQRYKFDCDIRCSRERSKGNDEAGVLDGKRNASKVLKDITNSPTKASQYKKAYSKDAEAIPPSTPFEALKMFVEADLTRRQYEIIRATNKRHFPCYDLLLKAKQEYYPPKSALRVTAICAEMDLQSLIDHTVTRLSKFLEEVLITLNSNERQSLTIILKWGCDGSQQTRYKQKFTEDADSDANIFLSSFVPIKIVCGEQGKKVVWQNPTPSSPRFCRPIRFRFVKKSTNITREEIAYLENAQKRLTATKVDINSNEYTFRHFMKMTMIDGKVCNAATNTSSTSRERRTPEKKLSEEQRKRKIQERCRTETRLLVDMPKANFGNTNDGNTSRRFFDDTELAAEITGINHEVMHRLKVILEVITSDHKNF
ncbi:unnamed protein product [Arctia plantaginis]|uniref:V(D)J recombination-activating protein 1 RNase H domain-containing protein n=1 Tax=Arctia plantaginis TaxID=874455 RepID=A0A8S1BJF5_ARCPL|nr:unnamed protein product [Arctia plantaginis]